MSYVHGYKAITANGSGVNKAPNIDQMARGSSERKTSEMDGTAGR
jgi:hypothetical protein